MKERWKDINGFENLYQISNFGRVKALRKIEYMNRNDCFKEIKEKILKPNAAGSNQNYLSYTLVKTERKLKIVIHRLVALHFIKNPHNYPIVLHLDDDPHNNKSSNLKWGTQKENIALKVLHNRQAKGEKHGCCKLKELQVVAIKQFLKVGALQKDIAGDFKVNKSTIQKIASGLIWKHIK